MWNWNDYCNIYWFTAGINTFQFPLTLFEPFVSKKKRESEIETKRPVKIEDMIVLDFNTWLTSCSGGVVITVTSL